MEIELRSIPRKIAGAFAAEETFCKLLLNEIPINRNLNRKVCLYFSKRFTYDGYERTLKVHKWLRPRFCVAIKTLRLVFFCKMKYFILQFQRLYI